MASLHSSGGSKAVTCCKINNLSILGTVALRGKECQESMKRWAWCDTRDPQPISLLPAELHVGPMTTSLGLSQLPLARFIFMRTTAFHPNIDTVWTGKGLFSGL